MDRVHDLRTRVPRHRVSQRLRHVTILGVLLFSALLHQAYAQPGDRVFEAGDSVVVLLGPLRVREGAGLVFATKGNQPEGAIGTILDPESRSADGYRWWHVRWGDAMSGWSADGTSQDAFFGRVQTADAGVGEVRTGAASDRGSSTDKKTAPPVGAASFDGQVSSPAFDPGRSLEVFSQLRADDPLWSYLTIDMRGGRLTWWRSTVGPR